MYEEHDVVVLHHKKKKSLLELFFAAGETMGYLRVHDSAIWLYGRESGYHCRQVTYIFFPTKGRLLLLHSTYTI